MARPARRTIAWVTWALIAVNVGIYIATVATGTDGDVSTSPVFRELVLYLPLVAEGEVWRPITTGFLHLGLIHIAVNMISLAMVGPGLELAFGRGRYTAIYGTSLLGSSGAALWLTPQVPVAGASGAIYGLLGAAFVLYLRQRLNPRTIVIVLVFNIGLSVTVPGISLAGHLGGLAFGALTAAAFLYYPEVCRALGMADLARNPATPRIMAVLVALLAAALIAARVLI